jgi:hypothetical protein
LPISLSVGFISSVPFVLLLPETDISAHYNRLGRRSLIKNVHAPVIISVSLRCRLCGIISVQYNMKMQVE